MVHQSRHYGSYFIYQKILYILYIKSGDMKAEDWNNWFIKVKKNSALIEHYVSHFPSDENNNSVESNSANYVDFKPLWQKVNVVKFFIEHVCHIDQILYKRCIMLWKAFDTPLDLKKIEHFEKLLKFLKTISNAMTAKYTIQCKGNI